MLLLKNLLFGLMMSISLTCFGVEDSKPKRDHDTAPETNSASSASSTTAAPATAAASGSTAAPATAAASGSTAVPVAPSGTTAGNSGNVAATNQVVDSEKLRLFQIKAFLASATSAIPKEKREQLFKTLAEKPKTEAEASAQVKLAKDLINGLSEETIPEAEKKQLASSLESLAGNTPATAEELRKAADDLLKPANPQQRQTIANESNDKNSSGATSDSQRKGQESGSGDPKNAALAELKKEIEALQKQIQVAKNNAAGGEGARNAELDKALQKLGEGRGGQEGGSGSGSGSGGGNGSGGSSPSQGDPNSQNPNANASTASESDRKKKDHLPSRADNRNDKKDLPPLFSESRGARDSRDNDRNNNNKNESQEEKTDQPLLDISKLKAERDKRKEKELAALDKSKSASQEASPFAGGDVLDPGAGATSKSDLPPGNSQIGQPIANNGSGMSAMDPSGAFGGGSGAGGGGGGLGASPVAGGGGGQSSGAGEFPSGVGSEGMGGYPGPQKFVYDKGNGLFKSGGGESDGGNDESSEGDGPAEGSAIPSNPSLKRSFTASENQVLIAPDRNANLRNRPGPFYYTQVARNFIDPKKKKLLKKLSPMKASVMPSKEK